VTPAQFNSLLLSAFVGTWTIVIPALAYAVLWYVKKDRDAFFGKIRDANVRIDANDELISSHNKSIDDLEAAVYGINGEGGVLKWDAKWDLKTRNLLQPFASQLEHIDGRLDKFALALARAVPGIELKDLQ
jgi:hypothetical protein